MSDDNLKQLSQLLDDKIKPVHGEIARITRELIEIKVEQAALALNLRTSDKNLARIESKITTIEEQLDHPEFGLKGLNQKVEDIMAELSEVHKFAKGAFELVK